MARKTWLVERTKSGFFGLYESDVSMVEPVALFEPGYDKVADRVCKYLNGQPTNKVTLGSIAQGLHGDASDEADHE